MMRSYSCIVLAAWIFASLFSSQVSATSCRCLPGDNCWPKLKEWASFNASVGGRLIATVPIGTPCHGSSYNATGCAILQEQWSYPEIYFSSPADIADPYFQNQSCDPYTPVSQPCTLGNLVEYTINASKAQHISAGIRFAQEKNIRLVIKNTGHDYLGKSTGKGALGIWTHNLKSIDLLKNYSSKAYTGPAMKMGAGVQAFEAYEAAHENGFRVLGGTCATVGVAGGYTQGAGHSVLSSRYGLSADNVLEWEVVTATGILVTATPTQNRDLYWALCGGGGGTYGVVLSMTTKIHPDGIVAGASLAFSSAGIGADAFWSAIAFWQSGLGPIADSGTVALYQVTNVSCGISVTSPDHSKEQVTALLQPFTAELTKRDITYALNITSFPNFYDHYNNYYGPLPYGPFPATENTGSRLIPRSVAEVNSVGLSATMRNITSNGDFYVACFALNVSHAVAGNTPSSNAVLPAWRSAIAHCIIAGPWDWTLPWSTMLAREDELTDSIGPQLEAVTPGSGSYLNEANFRQPNFQQTFYGSNYEKLRSVKKAHDPLDLFYAKTGVGSEAWTADGDGRLCRS